jgi:hypothetical protein
MNYLMMMKNWISLVSMAVLLTVGYQKTAFGQATATASASANVIAPISMTKTVDLNFGNIAVSVSAGGTVVLVPAGTRSAGGAGGVTLPVTSGTVAPATFTISGNASYTYAITLPSSVTITNGSQSMTVNGFSSTPSSTGTIGTGGTQNLTVGATLNVSAAQNPGTYTNATGVPVTVNYN